MSFLRFVANFERSGSRIPDAWSIILTFPLLTTFYLTKTEKRTKVKDFEYRHKVCKKWLFFAKNMLTLAKLRASWYQTVYFLKPHMFVYLPSKFQVFSITVTSFRQRGLFYPTTNVKRTPK